MPSVDSHRPRLQRFHLRLHTLLLCICFLLRETLSATDPFVNALFTKSLQFYQSPESACLILEHSRKSGWSKSLKTLTEDPRGFAVIG